jgi:mannose-6-phosphate isomerase-like protein (cupin superfamily)
MAVAMLMATACRHPVAAPPAGALLQSRLIRADEGVVKTAPWGHWLARVHGDTAATSKMALSLFTLSPGQAPHPPHQHLEEELMILVQGAGTWHLKGQESPAHQGDVVYAAPWDMHGLRNTGDTPLSYYVLKWTGKTAQ